MNPIQEPATNFSCTYNQEVTSNVIVKAIASADILSLFLHNIDCFTNRSVYSTNLKYVFTLNKIITQQIHHTLYM